MTEYTPDHSAPARRIQKKDAICYLTDDGYFLPTILSAISCRRFVNLERADVIILCVGIADSMIDKTARALAAFNIIFKSLKPTWREFYRSTDFRAAHISDVALGRFFMADSIDNSYRNILYLDGDTLADATIIELLDYAPGKGRVAAVADFTSFARHHRASLGADTRAYFSSIGLPGNAIYFNSGILLASIDTWREMSKSAFQFFIDNTALCHHHDQTAINMTYSDNFDRLSICWNFQNSYAIWGLDKRIHPRIRHFNGPVKPWLEDVWPFHRSSLNYKSLFAQVRNELPSISVPKINLYRSARQMAKVGRLRTIQRHELRRSLEELAVYESSTVC